MKVKIRDVIYDAVDEPIMIIMTDEDKEMISNMISDNYKFCCYPQPYTEESITDWMRT